MASGYRSTVGGGENDTARGSYSTVIGGASNAARGDYSTVSGGGANKATGEYSAIGGGNNNQTSGAYSVIPGGRSNIASGDYNFVFGENVQPTVNESHQVYFFGPSGNNPPGFLVLNRFDGDHPIHVGTSNSSNGNGAHLTAGGVWTNGSSRTFKERFVRYSPAEVLEKLRLLPVEGYFYRGTQEYHITPMAEDFYKLFGTGVRAFPDGRPNPDVDKYLSASDVAGVAILGIQAIDEQVRALQAENKALEDENTDLRRQIEQLLIRLSRLETQNNHVSR